MAKKSKTIDTERIRKAVKEILLAVGEDTKREGLKKTPERVARMYAELLGGMHEDPKKHLSSLFRKTTTKSFCCVTYHFIVSASII